MIEQEIYNNFMDWLKNTWIGLPESDFKEETVRQRYSVEEAKFLTGFPFRRTPLDELAALKGVTEAELAETEAILKNAANAGLIHGLSNWQEKPDTICNCDGEYCIWFETYNQMDHHKSLDASNFEVVGKGETCKGCGLCVKRCPMEALTMVNYPEADLSLNKKARVPKLELDNCLGCGVCVVKCPTKSLTLVPRVETIDPPQSVYDWSSRYMADVKKGIQLKRPKN